MRFWDWIEKGGVRLGFRMRLLEQYVMRIFRVLKSGVFLYLLSQ